MSYRTKVSARTPYESGIDAPNQRLAVGVPLFPRWLRPNLTLPETGCMISLWIVQQMISQAPIRNRYSVAYILFGFFVILLSRNVTVIATAILAMSVWLRMAFPISSWHDQHWMEWYSMTSLATGHNILLRSPLVGMSMASYLPQGDLFGGLFVALGIQKYWLVWQVIDPLLFLLPVLVAPCALSLAVFFGLVWYWPFADYTNAGGNLEVELAVMIGAIVCFRHGRKTAAVIMFAFAALMRQPYITIIPFIFVLLWRERDYGRMKLFAALLFLFGGVYILLDPPGAYWYEFRIWDAFQESFFNDNQGLLGNYSISSVPHAFGINDLVPWNQYKGIYMPLSGAAVLTLLIIAWRAKQRDTILFVAILAPVFVYIFARGYAQLHYVVASGLPFLAMIVPADRPKRRLERHVIRGLAGFLLWTGLCPLAVFAVAKTADKAGALWADKPLPVARTLVIGPDGKAAPVGNLDGEDAHHELLGLNQGLEFDFREAVNPGRMRLTGDHVQIQRVKGIDIWWATETQMRGIVMRGTVEYSADGARFEPPREFTNTLTYAAFPVTIELPRTNIPVQAIRLRAKDLYLNHEQWVLGNVEFFGK